MIARLLAVGLVAGVLAGLFVSLVQMAKVTPLIHAAETYESVRRGPGLGVVAMGGCLASVMRVGCRRAGLVFGAAASRANRICWHAATCRASTCALNRAA